MAINPPPIQEKTTSSAGLFPQVWVKWLNSIRVAISDIITDITALTARVTTLEGELGIDAEYTIARAIAEIQETYGDTVSVEAKDKSLRKWGVNESVGFSKSSIMTMKSGINEETTITSNGITTVISDSASDNSSKTLDFVEGHTISGSDLTFVSTNAGVALNGTTAATLTTALARATRARLSEPATGNIYFYQGGTTTGGVPDTGSEIHLIIPAGDIQSQKASTSISANDYWVITSATASVLENTSAWAQFRIEIKAATAANNKWYPITQWISASDASGTVQFFNDGDFVIVPKNHDVRMVATANTTGIYCACGISGPLALVQ